MGLTCNQKLVETSLIYRMEPKQNRKCWKNGEHWASRVRCVSPGGMAFITVTNNSGLNTEY